MSTDLLSLANNLPFIDELYARYQDNPASVDASWRTLFESAGSALGVTIGAHAPSVGGNGHANGNGMHAIAHIDTPSHVEAFKAVLPFTAPETTAGLAPSEARFGRTFGLVNAHRARGHMVAK